MTILPCLEGFHKHRTDRLKSHIIVSTNLLTKKKSTKGLLRTALEAHVSSSLRLLATGSTSSSTHRVEPTAANASSDRWLRLRLCFRCRCWCWWRLFDIFPSLEKHEIL
jgi:hypothetical protein